MGNDPDWLPEGWKVSVKVRRGSGKRDKYYVDPSNNRKFKSKPEVLRYLKIARGGNKPKVHNLVDKQSHIDVKNAVADNLPSGWIKKIRTAKKSGRIRKYPYYVDPTSGLQFQSVREVLHHLESTDSREVKLKPSAGANDKKLTERSISSGVNIIADGKKRPKLDLASGSKGTAKSDLSTRLHSIDRHEDIKKEKKNFSNSKEDIVYHRQRLNSGLKRVAVVNKATDLPNKPSVVTGIDRTSNALDDQTAQSGAKRFRMKISFSEREDDSMIKVEGAPIQFTKKDRTVTVQKRERSNSTTMKDLPRRTSQRLAQSETNEDARAESQLSCEPEVNLSERSRKINSTEEHSTKSPRENSVSSQEKEIGALPHGEKQERHLNSCMGNLFEDPCIEFAIKTLTGVIPIKDTSEAKDCLMSPDQPAQTSGSNSSGLTPADLWSDPCFEFAVKTLVGDIPLDGSSHSQTSFEQQPSSSLSSGKCNSRTLPQFRMDTVSFNVFNAAETPASKL